MVTAWLVIGLEKVRVVDRGPWLPAAGSEMPTVYVIELGSPTDFSFSKTSTAGDSDFTWETRQGGREAPHCSRKAGGGDPAQLPWTGHS